MPSVAVSTLLQRVEDAVDTENFVEQAVLLRWANAIHPRFVVKLARWGWAPKVSNYAITATGASSYVPTSGTPIEMLAVVGVYRQDGDDYVKLRPVDHFQKPGSRTAEATAFRVQTLDTGGISIELLPTPASGTYIVDYLPAPSQLVTGTPAAGQTDTVNYPAGWEEWLVLELARRSLGREETTNPALEEEIHRTEKDIEQMIRDYVYTSAKIRNVDGQDRGVPDTSQWVWL